MTILTKLLTFLSLWAVLLALSGCADQVEAPSDQIEKPAAGIVSTAGLASSPTLIPSPSASATVSQTPSPTSTATVIATPTATEALPAVLPSHTPSPTPSLTASATAIVAAPATPQPTAVSARTVRVGLHGRNDIGFHELDYQLVREAGIETLKMMSFTDPAVFERVRRENPDIEFIVRLYDDRMNLDGHPSPSEFADRIIPIMRELQPYVLKFEVGNEPNHVHRYEGWGPDDADAESFNLWFLEVYDLLKTAHPWAELGYPALGTPDSVHRDRAWLRLNRDAIERADWLGVHCYWQTPPEQPTTMFDDERGLCFKYYHEQFPDKPIELTEFDNDNIFYDFPLMTEAEMAEQYVAYYQELFRYPYIRSASSFIMSSPDSQNWEIFGWRTEAGHIKPVVDAVARMPRPQLIK